MNDDYKCVLDIQLILKNAEQLKPLEVDKKISEYIDTIDVNKSSKKGFTHLFLATEIGDVGVVQTLLQNGADPNITNIYGQSPLYSAAEAGRLDMVTTLSEHGADVNLQDKNGKTPLMYATGSGRMDVTKYLTKNGADINRQDNLGNTALLYSYKKASKELISYLLENGANTEIKNNRGISGTIIKKTIIETYNLIKEKSQTLETNINVKKKINLKDLVQQIKINSNNLTTSQSAVLENNPKFKPKNSTKFRDLVKKSRMETSHKTR